MAFFFLTFCVMDLSKFQFNNKSELFPVSSHCCLIPSLQVTAHNGKYASIEFGSRRRREALRAEGKTLPEDLRDDDGAELQGKRAAIQFAYDKAVKNKNGDAKEEDPLIEEMKKEVMAASGESEEKKAAKVRLLDKISKFGHFATTKVEPQEKGKKGSSKPKKDVSFCQNCGWLFSM